MNQSLLQSDTSSYFHLFVENKNEIFMSDKIKNILNQVTNYNRTFYVNLVVTNNMTLEEIDRLSEYILSFLGLIKIKIDYSNINTEKYGFALKFLTKEEFKHEIENSQNLFMIKQSKGYLADLLFLLN